MLNTAHLTQLTKTPQHSPLSPQTWAGPRRPSWRAACGPGFLGGAMAGIWTADLFLIHWSIGWFSREKFRGNSHISWEDMWFPVSIFPFLSTHWIDIKPWKYIVKYQESEVDTIENLKQSWNVLKESEVDTTIHYTRSYAIMNEWNKCFTRPLQLSGTLTSHSEWMR